MNEGLIMSVSMTQGFGFTVVLGKQAHSRLRNYFSSAAVESKDKLDSEIIEFSFLRCRCKFIRTVQINSHLQARLINHH